jgi:hypothetical protein
MGLPSYRETSTETSRCLPLHMIETVRSTIDPIDPIDPIGPR